MPIITITTDWKQGDYYLSALKGRLMGLGNEIALVDLNTAVEPFSLLQAMFLIKSSFSHFPTGSIHLITVLGQASKNSPMAVAFYRGHYFVGPNDGRFSLLTSDEEGGTAALDSFRHFIPEVLGLGALVYAHPFSELPLFTVAVKAILNNTLNEVSSLAQAKVEPVTLPVSEADSISGKVVHIDSYGNLITNINKGLFLKMAAARSCVIFVQGPYTKITKIVNTYREALSGEEIALFNSLGLLEIALIDGNFARQETITIDNQVIIKFY